jgi:hypothetical protein
MQFIFVVGKVSLNNLWVIYILFQKRLRHTLIKVLNQMRMHCQQSLFLQNVEKSTIRQESLSEEGAVFMLQPVSNDYN